MYSKIKKITLPWSKSITNRDLILASLFPEETNLSGILVSDDTRFMIQALKDLGMEIEDNWENVKILWWLDRIIDQEVELYVWQSGTCMRFLSGFLALIKAWKITVTWEERLLERPLWDLIDALKQMWVNVESRENKFPPVTFTASKITNNKVKMSGSTSSQFLTALLQIGAFVEWWIEIEIIWDLVSKPYIDMTINELSKFWIKVKNENYKKFVVDMFGKNISSEIRNITVEWDASAMSYIANYVVLHWWELEITNLWSNSKQWDYKYLEILEKYFWLEWKSDEEKTFLKSFGIENLDFSEKHLYTEELDFESMPDVSMSFMSLAIFLPWKTRLTWLQTLNLKECKRIDAMKDELRKLWVEVESWNNWIEIGEYKTPLSLGGEGQGVRVISTYNDHRIAMCFGILNSVLLNLEIENKSCVNKTYPKFWEDLEYLQA